MSRFGDKWGLRCALLVVLPILILTGVVILILGATESFCRFWYDLAKDWLNAWRTA